MIAKFKSTCRCGDVINPGDAIVVVRKGDTRHADCGPAALAERGEEPLAGEYSDTRGMSPFFPDMEGDEIQIAVAADRRLARRGISVVRFAGGASMVVCQCEDRPCCGCNS